MTDDFAYRFEYADESAFVVYPDGRAFIEFPKKDGHQRAPEEKRGKICNRIPLLIGQAVKPRQDEIDRLRALLRRCMPGVDIADLGNGEVLALYLGGGAK